MKPVTSLNHQEKYDEARIAGLSDLDVDVVPSSFTPPNARDLSKKKNK